MEKLLDLAKQVQAETKAQFDRLLTPEILAQLTPEQIEAINTAQNPINLSGGLNEKINELQNLLTKI